MYIIHETPSIVAIVTRKSKNRKTGNMLQIWLLEKDKHPSESRSSGTDTETTCKGCPLAKRQGCYVEDKPLIAIWKAYKRGSYKPLAFGSPEWETFWEGEAVRFGAFGNPSLLPLAMVSDIVSRSRRHTGYFHDWHFMPVEMAISYGKFFMASVEPHRIAQAKSLGLRFFATLPEGKPAPRGAIECLSDSKGLSCSECGLCDGTNRRDTLPSVWIRPHGSQKKKAVEAILNK